MGTYFTASTYTVTDGNIVYGSDLNTPFAAIDAAFTSLVSNIQTGSGLKYAADTGSANAYAVALDPAITSYEEGLEVWLKPANTNTGASTLAVNGLSAISIRRFSFQTLEAGDILANYFVHLEYSGGYFQIVSTAGDPSASAESSATAAAVSAAAALVSETNAAASAAAINLPAIAGSTALDGIRVNAAKDGYEFVQFYTETEVDAAISSHASSVTHGLYDAYVMVSDVKVSGTDGGTVTAGSTYVRDINTEDADTGSLCSIASNQITLAAGTYRCTIRCPARVAGYNVAWLYDTTVSAELVRGATSDVYGFTEVTGRFTITGPDPSVLEIRHKFSAAEANSGLGLASSWGDEIYTVAEFWREA